MEELRVPSGSRAKGGSASEPYTETGYASEVIHQKTGMEMVFVPAGEYVAERVYIGLTSPPKDHDGPHKAVLPGPFYMGKYPVTTGQYRLLDPGHSNEQMSSAEDYPVVCVNQEEAKAFCEWAGLTLPSEEEWEYACRAGGTSAYHFGDSSQGLGEYGWYRGNSGDRTHPVGQLKPNSYGLYDMHGNVSEWCAEEGVNHGGGFASAAPVCQIALRGWTRPIYAGYALGFRAVMRLV